MGASVPKSAAQVHDDAVANQHKVGDVLPPFHYKLPKDGKTGIALNLYRRLERLTVLHRRAYYSLLCMIIVLTDFFFFSGTEKSDQPKAMIPMSIYTYAALHELKHKQKSHIYVISEDLDLASTIA
ncbi:unnamed protein product [Brassica rapa]|uniref:Uncharacterized protein n=2 Tax=Brassica TaxID=3705 RepID=A0A3P6D540_BRACM|nr:unnamed protein product [Brassica napus]CAG7912078.1 unnamed protein product [Brassica rapa]VDD21188.1 unnamed protein product [Brassica rapa]